MQTSFKCWCQFFLFSSALLLAQSMAKEPDEVVPESTDCTTDFRVLRIGNHTIPGSEACYFSIKISEADGENIVPVSHEVASRWQVPQLSRIEDLGSFFKTLRIAARLPTKSRKKAQVVKFCIHGNATAPLGHCPSKWKGLDKAGIWKAERSPFAKSFIEVLWQDEKELTDVYISVHRDLDQHRVVWLVLGLALMPLASTLSKIVVLYYGVGMSIGVFLVVGILLFQLMKLLPLTRGSSIRLVFAGALMGMGGVLVTWLSGLASETVEQLGLGDQFVNPLVYLGLIALTCFGAALGFWFVRRFIMSPSGELDPSTIVFVKWVLWVFSGALLILSSADALLGMAALTLGVVLTLLTTHHKWLLQTLSSPRKALRVTTSRSRVADDELDEADVPGTPDRAPSRGPVTPNYGSPRLLQQTFVSSYHHIDGRRLMTPTAQAAVSKECTRAALADLIRSPEWGKWASENLGRVAILPETKREQRGNEEIRATAFMEEGAVDEM